MHKSPIPVQVTLDDEILLKSSHFLKPTTEAIEPNVTIQPEKTKALQKHFEDSINFWTNSKKNFFKQIFVQNSKA